MLVVVDGSVGVVSYDGFKFNCSVCSNSFCRHAKHVKKLKAEGDNIELKDFFSKRPRSAKEKKIHVVSSKKIPFLPTKDMEKNLLCQFGKNDLIFCIDNDLECCSGAELIECYSTNKKMYTKNAIHDCKGKFVLNKHNRSYVKHWLNSRKYLLAFWFDT